MVKKYINSLDFLNLDRKSFIIRQIDRMPDFYKFGVIILCSVFYILRLKPDSLTLFEKLISSLDKVRVNE